MGSRNDIQCPDCGKFRHWPCKVCGRPSNDHHKHDPDERGLLVDVKQYAPEQAESHIAMAAASDDSYAMIPSQSVLDRYIPRQIDGTTDLDILKKCWTYNHGDALRKVNVLLIGDAGTGKNHLAEALGAWAKAPVWSVSLNGGSTVEDIVGQPLFINGSTVWVDGVLTYAMRHGGIVVLDEVNACPNEITFVLHQILDNRRTLTLVQKGREVVGAHPDFFVIGTMNPDYRGTKPLNEAFKDRFHVPLAIDYDEKVEKKLMPNQKGIIELAGKLRKMFRANELDSPCSTRMLLDYVENKELFGDGAAKMLFLARYGRADQNAVSEAWDIGLGAASTNNLGDE